MKIPYSVLKKKKKKASSSLHKEKMNLCDYINSNKRRRANKYFV